MGDTWRPKGRSTTPNTTRRCRSSETVGPHSPGAKILSASCAGGTVDADPAIMPPYAYAATPQETRQYELSACSSSGRIHPRASCRHATPGAPGVQINRGIRSRERSLAADPGRVKISRRQSLNVWVSSPWIRRRCVGEHVGHECEVLLKGHVNDRHQLRTTSPDDSECHVLRCRQGPVVRETLQRLRLRFLTEWCTLTSDANRSRVGSRSRSHPGCCRAPRREPSPAGQRCPAH